MRLPQIRSLVLLLAAAAPLTAQAPAPVPLGPRSLPPGGGALELRLPMGGQGSADDSVSVSPGSLRVSVLSRSAVEHVVSLAVPSGSLPLGEVVLAVTARGDAAPRALFRTRLIAPAPALSSVRMAGLGGRAVDSLTVPDYGESTFTLTLRPGPFHASDTLRFGDPKIVVKSVSVDAEHPDSLVAVVAVPADGPELGQTELVVGGPNRMGVSSWAVGVRGESGPSVTCDAITLPAGAQSATVTLNGSGFYPREVLLRQGAEVRRWKIASHSRTSVTAVGPTPPSDAPAELVVVNRDERQSTPACAVRIGRQIGSVAVSATAPPHAYADTTALLRIRLEGARPPFRPTDRSAYQLRISGIPVAASYTVVDSTLLEASVRMPRLPAPAGRSSGTHELTLVGRDGVSWNGSLEVWFRPTVGPPLPEPLYVGEKARVVVPGSHLDGVVVRPLQPVDVKLDGASDLTHLEAELDASSQVQPGPVRFDVLKDGIVWDSFSVVVHARPPLSFVRVSVPARHAPPRRVTEVGALPALHRGDVVRLDFDGDSLPAGVGTQKLTLVLEPLDDASQAIRRSYTVRRGSAFADFVRVPMAWPQHGEATLVLAHETGEGEQPIVVPVRRSWQDRLNLAASASVGRWVMGDDRIGEARYGRNNSVGDALVGAWVDLSPVRLPFGVGAHAAVLQGAGGEARLAPALSVHLGPLSAFFVHDGRAPRRDDGAAAAPESALAPETKSLWYFMLGGSLSADLKRIVGGDGGSPAGGRAND